MLVFTVFFIDSQSCEHQAEILVVKAFPQIQNSKPDEGPRKQRRARYVFKGSKVLSISGIWKIISWRLLNIKEASLSTRLTIRSTLIFKNDLLSYKLKLSSKEQIRIFEF